MVLNWTLYPVNYENMENTVVLIEKIGGIELHINGDSTGEDKSSWRLPYTFEKQRRYDWLFCKLHKCGNNLLTMYEDTLSVCHVNRALPILEKRFCDKIPDEFRSAAKRFRANQLRISELKYEKEILEYMSERPDMCDYCSLRKRMSMNKWLVSKGQFEEWFV